MGTPSQTRRIRLFDQLQPGTHGHQIIHPHPLPPNVSSEPFLPMGFGLPLGTGQHGRYRPRLPEHIPVFPSLGRASPRRSRRSQMYQPRLPLPMQRSGERDHRPGYRPPSPTYPHRDQDGTETEIRRRRDFLYGTVRRGCRCHTDRVLADGALSTV